MADASRFPLGSKLTLDSLSIDPYPHYRLLLDREPVTRSESLVCASA